MNYLKGTIQKIETDKEISIIEFVAENKLFSAMAIEGTGRSPHLKVGDNVMMGFKETATSIGKDLSGELSIRNRFNVVIRSLTTDAALTKVVLDFQGHEFVSVITTASAERMELKPGDHVEGLVKTTDMILAKTDE